MFVPPRYSEDEAREAIAASVTWTEALRRLGRCPTGGAPAVLKKWVALWGIPTDHFDPNIARRIAGEARGRPLSDRLVEGSTISRATLKKALYREGLKTPACEICGQDENWQGRKMSLVLDHINGVRDDNRLENLRIVCPNCNATLDTHCGKSARVPIEDRECEQCGATYAPNRPQQRFCTATCAARAPRAHAGPRNPQRRAVRPPLDVLLVMIDCNGYEAVGRRFGVSGVAIRSWVKAYGMKPPPGKGRDRRKPPPPKCALGDDGAQRALGLLASGVSMYAVAKELRVSRNTIRDLYRGLSYKHIKRPHEFPLRA